MKFIEERKELVLREELTWSQLLAAESRLEVEPTKENQELCEKCFEIWEKCFDALETKKERKKDYILNFGVTGLKLLGKAGLILLAGNIELVQGKLFPPSARPRAEIGTVKL